MIYIDTSALVKLVVEEPESSALTAFLTTTSGRAVATSALARTELVQAARRYGEAAGRAAEDVVDGLITVTLTDALLAEAGRLELPVTLRSLDAIHVTCARQLGPTTEVVTYDRRMAEAVVAAGLRLAAPGVAAG